MSGCTEPFEYCIDTHGHYLFEIDDGSLDIEMSMDMIKSAYDQGVRDIICTSHSWGIYGEYRTNFDMLKDRVRKEGLDIRIHIGCEIRCRKERMDQIIKELDNGVILPIGNSDYILMEFSRNVQGEELLSCVKQIREKTKYKPIIAHPERYKNLHGDECTLQAIKELQIPLQINAPNLVGKNDDPVINFARRLLSRKLVTFIGSDAHRTNYRPVRLSEGIKYIYDNCDKGYADDICFRNAKSILNI